LKRSFVTNRISWGNREVAGLNAGTGFWDYLTALLMAR
jgi:hypothetical protein